MIKLYNPILDGEFIKEYNWVKDSYKDFDSDVARDVLSKYPFVVDINNPIYRPSYIDYINKKNRLKKIWLIIKTRLLKRL